MATIKITAKRCDEFNCPYLEQMKAYSPDPFEGSYYFMNINKPKLS